MTPIRVLELRSVWGTGGGPEKTILLGAARSNPSRYAVTVCYIRDARDTVFAIDKKAGDLPIDYVEVVERHSFDRSIWPVLRRLVQNRRIDIVHAHDCKTDVLAWLLHRAEGVIPLSTAHGWAGHSRRERLLYHRMDKQILRLFPKVITVSEDIRQELVRSGAKPGSVQTVLNGIDHTRFHRDRSRETQIRQRLGIADDEVVIGAVGRLETEKRFDLLIDAFASLQVARLGLRLVIVGEGSLRNTLEAQVDRLGLGGVCRLLGQRSDIVDLHHAFNVFVQSSANEGAPNAVLEAMALETPVVATAVGGTAQLVRDGIDGLLVPAGKIDALADAINRVLTDGQATAARVVSARDRVETELSFDARMATLEAVYTELYNQHHRTADAAVVPA
jgi:glycosyltransferase involved in cell wall biosynthesis